MIYIEMTYFITLVYQKYSRPWISFSRETYRSPL